MKQLFNVLAGWLALHSEQLIGEVQDEVAPRYVRLLHQSQVRKAYTVATG